MLIFYLKYIGLQPGDNKLKDKSQATNNGYSLYAIALVLFVFSLFYFNHNKHSAYTTFCLGAIPNVILKKATRIFLSKN